MEHNIRAITYGERTLSDENKRTVDYVNALSWRLESLGFLGQHVDVIDHLSWCCLCHHWDGESNSCNYAAE